MITTGHLCSGYDGLGQALDLAGEEHETLWHAEYDAAPSAVLKREQPAVPNVGDLTADVWHMAPHVDLLTAGFPCQPVSIAGAKLAQNDPRWLWPAVINVVRAVRPWRVFLENVQNIVSIGKGEILRLILADLQAAGYASRWVVLGACAVGAPHHRHRWFLVADYVGEDAPEAVRIKPRAVCGAPRNSGRVLLASPKATDYNAPGTKRMERGEKPWHELPTHVALLPTPLARDAEMRNEGSPEYWAARPDKAPPLGAAVALLPTPNARDGGERGAPSPEHAARRAADPMRSLNLEDAAVLIPDTGVWGKYAEPVALWERATGYAAPRPTVPGPNGGVRLNPALPEWMMGLRPGLLTKDATRNEALKMAGNGVVPRQAAAAYRMLTQS